MNSKFHHFLFLFIVNVFFMIQCSAGSSLENDRLTELTERLDRMQSKIEAQELEMEKSNKRYHLLEAEFEKFKLQNSRPNEDIVHLKSQISNLESLLPTESASKYATNLLTYRKNNVPTSRASTPPSSCDEMTGFASLSNVDGIYLVQNKDTKKVEAVFCQFSSNPISQNLIGSVNPQKKTIHFYVQRNTPVIYRNAVIAFDLALLNEGSAFDLPSGTFTVPVNGIYHFEFHGVKPSNVQYAFVLLQVNGATASAATGDVTEGVSSQTVSLSASLRLSVNDKVTIYNNQNSGLLEQQPYHLTHFVGWLVEEDLM